jgi:hypothetical protein
MNETSRKVTIAIVAFIVIALNVATFISAYPQMFQSAPNKARDFSAYYVAAWRLFFNPAKIYAGVAPPGDYPISPRPSTYRYAPSFLLLASPFLFFNYQTAMILFNLIQLFLLPFMALMIYRILQGRNLLLVSTVLVLILLQPLPGLLDIFQTWRWHQVLGVINTGSLANVKDTFSWSYYYNWIDGNAKVLTTFLLLSCFYFGRILRPYTSGFFLGLACFDPRFALLSLPLGFACNRTVIRPFLAGMLGTLLASNFLILYHSMGFQFVKSIVYHPTGFYAYSWIPFYAIVGLTLTNYREIITLLRESIYGLRRYVERDRFKSIDVTQQVAVASKQ